MKSLILALLMGSMPLACADEAGAPADPMQEPSGLTWYQVAALLAALGGGGALGWQGCKKMQAMRIEPQPLEVRSVRDPATRAELDDFKDEVREDFRRVHARIDKNDQVTAEIRGQLVVIANTQQRILDLLLKQQHDA